MDYFKIKVRIFQSVLGHSGEMLWPDQKVDKKLQNKLSDTVFLATKQFFAKI